MQSNYTFKKRGLLFRKTEEEKSALKKAKLEWRESMRKIYPDFTNKKACKFSQQHIKIF